MTHIESLRIALAARVLEAHYISRAFYEGQRVALSKALHKSNGAQNLCRRYALYYKTLGLVEHDRVLNGR